MGGCARRTEREDAIVGVIYDILCVTGQRNKNVYCVGLQGQNIVLGVV